jgi:hypothetical protein
MTTESLMMVPFSKGTTITAAPWHYNLPAIPFEEANILKGKLPAQT